MSEVLLAIDQSLGRRAGLEHALRAAIRSGQLEPGTSVPSTRVAAAEFGLSRATVVAAYDQLKVEGYLLARQGSGTVVAERPGERFIEPARAKPAERDRQVPTGPNIGPTADFRPGQPDLSLFPRAAWVRSMRRVTTDAPDEAFGYPDFRGCAPLRHSLATYLSRSRAVFAEPTGVAVYGGAMAAVAFLAAALRTKGVKRVAVEDPSLVLMVDALRLGGVETVPIQLDKEGLVVADLDAANVGAVVVTPSHQYPVGIAMSPGRRAELLQWASEGDRWIIEDDYDGEFRYDRQPVGALQGLDPDRVIYMGTASKSLGPGLRLAWCIVPEQLRPALAQVTRQLAGVSALEQLALADFIDRGSLDTHLRKVRAIYERRQRTLTARLRAEIGWLETPLVRAGLHVTASLQPDGPSERAVIDAAAERSVALLGLGWHRAQPADPAHAEGLVIGFSRPPQHAFASCLDQLLELLADF